MIQSPTRRAVSLALASGLLVPQVFASSSGGRRRVGSPEKRLIELGYELPQPPAARANYVPFRRSGKTLFLAGLGPVGMGTPGTQGRLGQQLTVDQGYALARSAGLNVLAVLRSACGGSLDRVSGCLRVGVFVSSADDFHDQSRVANGASDLFVEVFGDAGLHTRFAVGVNTLPFDIPVEIESVWELA